MLVAPHRLYIKDGPVQIIIGQKKRDGHLYLMNDIAIICKIQKKQVAANIFGIGDHKTIDIHKFEKRISLAKAAVKAESDGIFSCSRDLFSLLCSWTNGIPESFSIITGGETYRMWVKDNSERSTWVKEIHEAVQTRALKEMLEDNIKQSNAIQNRTVFPLFPELNSSWQNISENFRHWLLFSFRHLVCLLWSSGQREDDNRRNVQTSRNRARARRLLDSQQGK